ncbi:MAG: hypothetical protein WAV95_17165 [Azonexus sp.]
MTSLETSPLARLPILLLAMVSLVVGTLAGLARMSIDMHSLVQSQAGAHGALMIAAFFGTVISLERAVALHRLWPYLAPVSAAVGGITLLAGSAPWWPPLLFVVASTLLVMANGLIFFQQRALFTFTLCLGASGWLVGNVVWLSGASIAAAIPFWMLFLILTIAGERLELTRVLPPRPLAQRLFIVILAVTGLAAVTSDISPHLGERLLGGGLFGLALWLLRYDIVRKTVRQSGLPRFIASALLSGYGWLAVGALLGLAGAFSIGHPWRDAALHSIFLGFVFSMVIGHAPIIFPTILRVRMTYHPFFYLPLAMLHLSLLLRLTANLGSLWELRQASGIANAAALLAFVLTMVGTILSGRRHGAPGTP